MKNEMSTKEKCILVAFNLWFVIVACLNVACFATNSYSCGEKILLALVYEAGAFSWVHTTYCL